MPRKLSFDRVLFVTILLLCTTGLVMIYSASAVIAAEQHGSPYHFLIRQSLAMTLGLIVMAFLMRANYRALARGPVVYALYAATVVMLIGALLSPAINGTHRWMRLGPVSLQPSEFAKLALILLLAWRLHRAAGEKEGPGASDLGRTVIPCVTLSGFLIFLVVLQPDLGTAIALSLLVALMLMAGGVKPKHMMGLGACALVALLILVPLKGYQLQRVAAFINPGADPLGAGYQVRQSTIAVGAGGAVGLGLSEGKQKLFFLPYPYTDFVYAVIGEELGLIGAGLVASAFLVLMWRGLRVAARAPDLFGSYLAVGLTMFLVVQAMINIGVALGMLPAKGLPLPFISYGGSSLVAGLAASGVLLNISQYSS